MKSIAVPINAEAAKRLDLAQEREDDLIEVLLDEATFDLLFSVGWVRQVNDAAACNIDEHEDEHVETPFALEKVIEVSSHFSHQSDDIFSRIAALATQAKERGTGLHFYF